MISHSGQLRRVETFTSSGHPCAYWERVVPRVPDELLAAVVFLYPSENAAKEGVKAGGTGFLVDIHSRLSGHKFRYLVTNRHIANGGFHVVRANTEDGFDILRIPAKAWVVHRDGDDVAAAAIETPDHWKIDALDWVNVCPTPERM